jgi:hypothetical protein
MPWYALPADPGRCRICERGGVGGDPACAAAGAWVGARQSGPPPPRAPGADQAPRGWWWPKRADVFCRGIRDGAAPGRVSRVFCAWARRPGRAHRRRPCGRIRPYHCGSCDGLRQPPARARARRGRRSGYFGPTHRLCQRPSIGRCGLGDAATGPRCEPVLRASTGRRRPGTAGVWVCRARATRTRTTGSPSIVRRVRTDRSMARSLRRVRRKADLDGKLGAQSLIRVGHTDDDRDQAGVVIGDLGDEDDLPSRGRSRLAV